MQTQMEILASVSVITEDPEMTPIQKTQAINRLRRSAWRSLGFYSAGFRRVDNSINAALNSLPAEGLHYGGR